MGEMVHLSLGRIRIATGKNESLCYYANLFKPEFAATVPHFYAGDPDDPDLADRPLVETKWSKYRLLIEHKPGFAAPLSVVADRLRMLGYTDEYCREEFEVFNEHRDAARHDFSFDEMRSILSKANFADGAFQEKLGSIGFANFMAERVLPQFGKKAAARIRLGEYDEVNGLTPLSALYLLSKNPTARALPLMWQFADVKEGEYAPPHEFDAGVSEEARYLLVTEGTSDAQILRHALQLLRPNISDFFHFVDMQDNYPFSGTGNLYRFIQGLVSIRIKNQIVIIFDNDAEGTFNWERAQQLTPLPNLKIIKLPALKRFKRFKTIGPTGERITDINGKAAAIEAYLDVGGAPVVRWTNYDSVRDCYQGHVVAKAELAKAFLRQRSKQSGYDYSGLESVLTLIADTCAEMAKADSLAGLKNMVYVM